MYNDETEVFGGNSPKQNNYKPLFIIFGILLVLALVAGLIYKNPSIIGIGGGEGESEGTEITETEQQENESTESDEDSKTSEETPGAIIDPIEDPVPPTPDPDPVPPTLIVAPYGSIKASKSIDVGETYTLDAKSNQDELYWEVSDGTTLQGAKVTHSFAAPGQYEVVLKTKEDVELDKKRITVSVGSKILEESLNDLRKAVRSNRDSEIDKSEKAFRDLFDSSNAVITFFNSRSEVITEEKKLDNFLDAFILAVDAGKKNYSGIKRVVTNINSGKVSGLEVYD